MKDINKEIEEILKKYVQYKGFRGIHDTSGSLERNWLLVDKDTLLEELSNLLTKQVEEAEQRGFTKAWAVVKKLMSYGSPEKAEQYLTTLRKEQNE